MLQSLYQSKTRHATWLELFFDLPEFADAWDDVLSHTHCPSFYLFEAFNP